MALFRRPVRSRPIRVFLISMFAVPLVSLVALWVFAASTTVTSAISDHYYNTGTQVIQVGFASLTAGLPEERADSYVWLTADRATSNASLLAAQALVNKGIPAAKNALAPVQSDLNSQSRANLDAFFSDLGQLGSIRAAIDNGTMTPLAAFQAYTNIIDAQYRFYFSSIKDNGAPFADVSIGATEMSVAIEMADREAVLVGGALVDRGQMSAPVRQLFASTVAQRRAFMDQGIAIMTPQLGAAYSNVETTPEYQELTTLEDQISSGSGSLLADAGAWQAASGAFLSGMEKAEIAGGGILAGSGASLGDRLVTEAVLAGGVGLIAVVASVFLLVWFGRKVTSDLTKLDGSVRSMAEERLPRLVKRLRRGDDVEVAEESPTPATSTIREISQIADSFGTVQEAAIEAAVDQARLRKGVNQIFLNISMRNQSLLHRQLAMLDSMERRTSEPTALADLFRLDHLTTRMRRHAEGLIILSGATPGRGWRDPVPVVDVLRAAVAEVEDYVRVDVTSESRDLVAGSAVNDVIHLVAELIENATVFSPPNTRIEVRADRVGTGLVAEVEDRGLGLGTEERAEINRRLTSSAEFDLANSEQLGLFVVSQLAARHNIKVTLRESMYGGTTAVLLLPFGVMVREEEAGLHIEPGGWPTENDPDDGQGFPSGLNGSSLSPGDAQGYDGQPGGLAGRHRALDRPVPEPRALPSSTVTSSATTMSWNPEVMTPWRHAFEPPSARREERPGEPESAGNGHSGNGQPGNGNSGNGQPAAGAFGAQASVPQEQVRSGPTSSGSHLGMPIRVPQGSLAPQLRAQQRDATAQQEPAVPEAGQRSPEATRDMLILMQQGWQHGRVDDLENPEGTPGNGTH
jgi:signal transduction histidine kinase